MSDLKAILSFIKSVRRKRFLLHAFHSILTSTLILLLSILLISLLKKIFYFKIPYEYYVYLATFLFSFTILFLLRFRYYSSILKNAIYIDNRFSLKDRLSSYIDGQKKDVPKEILHFQGDAINRDILPELRGEKTIDLKAHPSFKYVLALLILLFLLPYLKDKKRQALILSQEEKMMLNEQEDNIKNFIAYLKNEDLSSILTEKKIKELSDTFGDAVKKIKETGLDKREAIKLLSKLVDSSKKFMEEAKNDLTSTQRVSEFDTSKMNKENEFKKFLDSKKDDLKDKLKDLKDKDKSSQEKQNNLNMAKNIMDAISKKADGQMRDMPGDKQSGSKLEDELTKEDLEQLQKEINNAFKELDAEGTKVDLEAKLKGMNDSLDKAKKGFSETPSGENGKGLDYEEGERDKLVTFNSRINKIEKGAAGIGKGPGTTNEDIGYATFDPSMPQKGKEIHDLTETEYEKIYAPSRVETEKEAFVVKGALGEGASITLPAARALPKKTAVNTPYAEVYKDYRDVAQKAVGAQKVPRVYKDYVLDYFNSINPDLR
jgi:hypothetical protein